jgi:hypothetical protein
MFIFSYQFFVLVFSAFYVFLFWFLLRKPKPSKAPDNQRKHELLYLFALLALLILPWIVYEVINPQSFRNVDIFTYMPDSQQILQQGQIPPSNLLLECQYYATFPVFTLLLTFLTGISGVTALQGAYIINIVIQVLFWLSIWVLLRKSFLGNTKTRFVFLGIVLAAFANPYLYGYFNTPLPQTLGLCVLLLLFIACIPAQKSYSIIFIALLIIGLIHVSIIPIFLLVLLAMLIFKTLSKQNSSSVNANNNINRTLLPSVIFLTYLFYTIAIYPVSDYLQKTLSFMSALAKDALSGQVAVTEGLSRGPLYPLNALGPALIIGATLSYLILYLQAIRNHKEKNDWLGAIAVLALLFMILGAARGQLDVWGIGFFSLSRYFNLPGYALATVVASWVISQSFSYEKRKWVLALLVTAIVFSAIGGLLDPLVF